MWSLTGRSRTPTAGPSTAWAFGETTRLRSREVTSTSGATGGARSSSGTRGSLIPLARVGIRHLLRFLIEVHDITSGGEMGLRGIQSARIRTDALPVQPLRVC